MEHDSACVGESAMMTRRTRVPFGVLMLLVALVFGIGVPTQAHAQSIDASTYWSKVNGFLNDGQWSNGISWNSERTPKLNTSWSSKGCCAYAADFGGYVYGLYGRSVDSMTPFYSASEIQTGDIIHTENPTHWFVVLKRDGDNLYTAEGNYLSTVRASLSTRGYFVRGNTLYQAYTNSDAVMSFSVGYHANIVSSPPNQAPWGNFGICEMESNCVHVGGWAFDPDASSSSIDVHIYIGGPSGTPGAPCIPILANMASKNINNDYGIDGNHGFDYTLFTDKNGSQEVYAYAIDTAGGNESYIGKRTVWCSARSSDSSVTDGTYYIVPAHATDKCLDVENASEADGANVQIFSRNGTSAQQWQLTKLSDGSFKIISRASGKALDVTGASGASGANVQQYTWNDSSAQHWFLVRADADSYYLTPKCSAMCLDVYDSGTSDGTNVTQYWRHGGANQKFKLISAEENGIDINEANFPDPIFRAYVRENFDLTRGGKLSNSEISKATTVSFQDSDIASLKGIELLTSLNMLVCLNTKVTELDLSKNIRLEVADLGEETGSNPLRDPSAVLASLPQSIKRLGIDGYSLTELGISHLVNLEFLHCDNNKLTGELDLSSFSNLSGVSCCDNELTRIILPNKLMSQVECDNNHLVCILFQGRGGTLPFSCKDNTRIVETAEDGTFDLSTLPDFDVSRAEGWTGGTVEGNILTFTDDKVSYTYKCRPGYETASLYKGTFTLIRKKKVDISETSIAAIPDQNYTGTALTPAPVITYGGVTLTEGVDYTVAYRDNVGSSSEDTTATITITGIGDYTGSTTITFKIVAPAGQGGSETPGNQGPTETPGNQDGSETPGNQMAEDGTAVGEGASEQAAEKAIISQKTDADLKGSTHTKLVFQTTGQTKTSISYKWKKVAGAKKYVLYGNACGTKNRMKKIATVRGTKYTLKKAAGKKVKKGTYYKMVLVAIDAEGKVISTSKTLHVATKGGKVGNNKKVKTAAKKNKVTLKRGKTFKLRAKAVPASKKLKVRTHIGMRYESSNKRIAIVSKKGVIKGMRTGTCYVFAYSQDGKTCVVKVTVK